MANVRRRNSVPTNRGELFMRSLFASLRFPHHRKGQFSHAGCRSDWSEPIVLEPLARLASSATVRQWCLRQRKNGAFGIHLTGAGLSEVSL